MIVRPKHQRLVLVVAGASRRWSARCCSRCGACRTARPISSPRPTSPPARPRRTRRCGSAGWSRRARSSAIPTASPSASSSATARRARRSSIRGIIPDLFREGSGVVAEGRLRADGTFVADNILAKHDERYMPPQIGNQAPSTAADADDDRRSRPRRAVAGGGAAALQLAAGVRRCAASRGGGSARSARSRSRRALLTLFAFGAADRAVPAHRPVASLLVAANSHSAKPWHLQVRRRLGQSRRLDAAVGDGAGAGRRGASRCSSGASTSARWSRRSARRRRSALGFYAFLLFASNPFERLDPGAARGQGPQPVAPGPRPRLPPADALPRLCRPVGRVQPRGRRAADRARSARRSPGRCGRGCWPRGSC